MNVPKIEVMAREIKRKMVRLTELKKVQVILEFFVVLEAAIIPKGIEEIPLATRIASSFALDIGHSILCDRKFP